MAEKGAGDTSPEDKTNEKDSSSSLQNEAKVEKLMENLMSRFRHVVQGTEEEKEKPGQLLEEVTFEGVAKFMKTKKCKNVIVMTGAGVSTAAGIPDFRTPGTGLYDNLQKYNLPSPEYVFEINYFKSNPEPFYKLAKEIYPGLFKPTITHYFIKLLEDKGLLLRIYTQNIDTLERRAGISGDKIVEAHGTFHTAHCLDCRKEYSQQFVKDEMFQDIIPKCTECEGLVKPDIVFFGESLPSRFFELRKSDMANCDLLIVMGTSLVVQPFASLIDRVPETTPRLLINREKAGSSEGDWTSFLFGGGGFCFDEEDNYRDVAWLGNADDGCLALADLLEWKSELTSMVSKAHKSIDDANKGTVSSPKSYTPGECKTPKGADSNPKPKTLTSSKTKKPQTVASKSSPKKPASTEEKWKVSKKETSKSSASDGHKDQCSQVIASENDGTSEKHAQGTVDDISDGLSKTSLEDTSQSSDKSKM